MAYDEPKVRVYQEFSLVPTAITDPLRAHVSGPHAYLCRHDEPAERPLGAIGGYSPIAGIAPVAWPGRPPGGLVDLAYTRVFIDGARLEYLNHARSGTYQVAAVSTAPNQVRSGDASGAYAAGNGAALYGALNGRPVTPGDRVELAGLGSDSAEHTLSTYVLGVASTGADRVAAAVASNAVPVAGNAGAQGASATVTLTSGTSPNNTLTTTLTNYSAYADGVLNETYQVTVTRASTGGDFSTALLRIASASGLDDVASVAPAVSGSALVCGNRGLSLTFTHANSTTDNLLAGQSWQVVVHDDYVVPAITGSGTYVGTRALTYLITCTQGGLFAASDPALKPAFSAVAVDGSDLSGPTTVAATAAAFAVGTLGVRATIAATGTPTGVRKGDRWTLSATPAGDGAYRTLVLAHGLPPELAAAADLDLRLQVAADVEVPALSPQGVANWTATTTSITLGPAIAVPPPAWPDGLAVPTLPVVAGDAFVHYRAWLPGLAAGIGSVSDPALLDDAISGPLSPDNPLKYAVYKALANSNGTDVRFTAVADPDSLASWTACLSHLVGLETVYGLAPQTTDRAVHELYAAHVASESSAEAGRWRKVWVPLAGVPNRSVVTGRLATVRDDPSTPGTQYTLLESPGAGFIAAGVRTGDEVRYLYGLSAGAATYSSFTVDAVVSEDAIRLVAGPQAASPVPRKFEIWHNLSRDEEADAIAASAAVLASSRVCAVWPDTLTAAGQRVPGSAACAALAGLRSGVVPHQGLTHLEVTGFDSVDRANPYFNGAQLDRMAAAGVWILVRDSSGAIVTRHATTTLTRDLNFREEMVVANFDAVSYFFQSRLRPFIGRTNVTPDTLSRIKIELVSAISYLKQAGYTPLLGGMLLDGTPIAVRQHAFLKDRVVAQVSVSLPYPDNDLDLYLSA